MSETVSVRHVKLPDARDVDSLNRYLESVALATPFHRPTWFRVLSSAYHIEPVYLVAERQDQIIGCLPLGHCRAGLLGRALVTLPFAGARSGLLGRDELTTRALKQKAAAAATELGVNFIEIRDPLSSTSDHTGGSDWQTREDYCHFRLELTDDIATIWSRDVDSSVRTKVRATKKRGLTTVWRGIDALDDFLVVYRETMKRLGSPMHSPAFFRHIFDAFGSHARLLTVLDNEGVTTAAAVVISDDRWIGFPFAASATRGLHQHPNNLLYWHLIETAKDEGFERLDMGRSPIGGGTAHFKRQWGANEDRLQYDFLAVRGKLPELNANAPSLKLAARVWHYLPNRVTDTLGPILAKRLP